MNQQSAFTITKLKFNTHIHVCIRGDPVAGPVGQGTVCSYGHVRGSGSLMHGECKLSTRDKFTPT